jgi:hypothetical protein
MRKKALNPKKLNRMICTPRVRKFIKNVVILSMMLFFLNECYFQGRKKQNPRFELSLEEHESMEKLFRYLMLREGGIYTLLGSKPLTDCSIFHYGTPESQRREENKNSFVYFLLNRGDKNDMQFYQKLSSSGEEDKAYLISNSNFIYNFETLWGQWEKIQHRFPLKNKFLLIKKSIDASKWQESEPECTSIDTIIFIDVLKTALVIQQNYEAFKQALGHDFDPLKIVFDLANEDSILWNKINNPSYCHLWGILYGFGKENAYSYLWSWRYRKNPDIDPREARFAEELEKQGSCKDYPSPSDKDAFTLSNFPIPSFAVYSDNDPVVVNYEIERENIRKAYRGQDFVAFTLELLVGNR